MEIPGQFSAKIDMSIIGLSMAVLPCRAEEDVEAGSAALRVDWPVYPRRVEHDTVAEGRNRTWAEIARQNAVRWPRPTTGPGPGASAGPRYVARTPSVGSRESRGSGASLGERPQ
jgi:hypothetical protein